jgi:predicted MPP superfamily phosphohydrolase
VAQLSDLHYGTTTDVRLIHEAVAASNAARPDIVVVTGDFVSRKWKQPENVASILKGLKSRHGVYGILGNHDHGSGARPLLAAMASVGITMLVNHAVQPVHGLWLVGVDDEREGRPDVERAFRGVRPCSAMIVLAHSPRGAESMADKPCIVLSGDTHGGQVRIPFFTKYAVKRKWGKPYVSGWFEVGQARIYVNQGIGNTALSVRFRCPPEVALFHLQSPEMEVHR